MIISADRWATNGDLIAAVAELGILTADMRVLDPTYGEGIWWTRWAPDVLVRHDLHKLDGVDFRRLPHPDGSFDAATFDPTYVCVGGRATSTVPGFLDRFGMDTAPTTPAGVQEQMHDGLTEVARVVRAGGPILVKCQAYIWSGKLWEGDYRLRKHAEAIGLVCVERLDHIGDPGPQPKRGTCDRCDRKVQRLSSGTWSRYAGENRTICEGGGGHVVTRLEQYHAARNLSTLYIFRRPRVAHPTLFGDADGT